MAFLLKMMSVGAAGCVGESYLPKSVLNTDVKIKIPSAYGAVVLVNVIGSTMTLVTLSMKVGAARKKYGVELPKMQAEGDSEEARLFNCVQRGHHNALETYPSFLVCSLIGGLAFPLTTTVAGLAWIYGRLVWAEGYATGKPDSRYSHPASYCIWYSLFGMIAASTGAAAIMLKPLAKEITKM